MRRVVFAVLLFISAGVWSLSAQQFRVATWQLNDLPSVQATAPPSAADEERFAAVATSLSAADADAIILYGVQHSESARVIGNLMKPRKYSVALFSAFRHNGSKGPFLASPVAILTRKERLAGRSIEWVNSGRIDLPGGFGFAVFRHGQSALCIYVAGLPGSLTNGMSPGDGTYFARKRNYAAQYLAYHASWLATTYTNTVVATYLTGDFSLTPKGPVLDECTKILDRSGFRVLAPGPAQDKSTTSLTNSLLADRVMDPIFTRGIEFMASRLAAAPAPQTAIMICDLTLKTPGTAAKTAPGSGAVPQSVSRSSKPEPAPAPAAAAPAPPQPAVAPLPTPPLATPAPALTQELGPRKASVPSNEVASAADVSQAPVAPAALLRSGAPNNDGDRVWLWLVVVAGTSLFLGIFSVQAWRARRRHSGLALGRLGNDAMFLELNPAAPSAQASATEVRETAVLSGAPTITANAQNVLWQQAAPRGGIEGSEGRPRVSLMPHLRRLIRERLVVWLSGQRSQLLESQERGTEQVLGLEVRLERLKNQFQERLFAQQKRIAELDTALRSKEKIILELLRAKPPEGGRGSSSN